MTSVGPIVVAVVVLLTLAVVVLALGSWLRARQMRRLRLEGTQIRRQSAPQQPPGEGRSGRTGGT